MTQQQNQYRGNNNPADDVVKTPQEARQGVRGARIKWVLWVSLLLAAIAGFILVGQFMAAPDTKPSGQTPSGQSQ
jgi:uncharacterized membrane protein YgcG